jgi:hypothetical protein
MGKTWRNLPCQVVKQLSDGWFKIMVLTPIKYCVIVKENEIG